MNESIKNERIEGERPRYLTAEVLGFISKQMENPERRFLMPTMTPLHEGLNDTLGNVCRVVEQLLIETAAHFIEQGIQTERNRSKPDGEDGAVELLREVVDAFDQTTFIAARNHGKTRIANAVIAAHNYIATQPDTPAEEVCETCGGKGWKPSIESGGMASRDMRPCPYCTPTDPEGGPYRNGQRMPGVKCWPCGGNGIYNGGKGSYLGSKPGSCGICRGDGQYRLNAVEAKIANAAYAAGQSSTEGESE